MEISVDTPDILASIGFYESLGLRQIATGEIWPYPYAVMSDGRLFLGLHQRTEATSTGPTLCFVHADLAQHANELRKLGVVFDRELLGSDSFNELRFRDPNEQPVRLIEARTFSPPDIDAAFSSHCGYFVEYGIPVKEFETARAYWEPLGFVAMEEETQPFNRVTLTSNYLNLGLHRSRAIREPLLVFEDEHMQERLALFKARGIELSDTMPDALDEHSNAVLVAPEGTRLLLMHTDN